MAEDDRGTGAGAKDPGLAESASAVGGPTGAKTPSAGEKTEWTASDERGPLGSADHVSHGSEFDPTLEREAAEADGPGGGEAGRPPVDELGPGSDAPSSPEAVDRSPSVREARSPWPIAVAIVVGAIIGAGGAIIYDAMRPDGAAIDKRIAALSARVDALQTKPDEQSAVASLKASVGDLNGKLTDLGAKVSAQGAKVASEATAAKAPAAPAFDPAPLTHKIDGLASDVASLRKQAAADKADDEADDKAIAAVAADVTALKTRDGAEGKTVADLQSEVKGLAGKLSNSPALAVVADSLVGAIDHGQPYAAQVEALSAIGADPAKVAVLKENADKGVPSAQALATRFAALADSIVATDRPTLPKNAGFLDKLKSGMFGMVSVRSVGDTGGTGVASRVSAIEADLAHDDVTSAYTSWTALPAAAKTKSEAWGALAKTHVEAMDAARSLRSQAIAALGAKKS